MGKRPLATVRSVGRLIVCSHIDCGDPRSGAVVGQVVDVRYAAAAISLHESTHPTPAPTAPPGEGPPTPKAPRRCWLAGRILRAPFACFFRNLFRYPGGSR